MAMAQLPYYNMAVVHSYLTIAWLGYTVALREGSCCLAGNRCDVGLARQLASKAGYWQWSSHTPWGYHVECCQLHITLLPPLFPLLFLILLLLLSLQHAELVVPLLTLLSMAMPCLVVIREGGEVGGGTEGGWGEVGGKKGYSQVGMQCCAVRKQLCCHGDKLPTPSFHSLASL